jgi:hypothetical protein
MRTLILIALAAHLIFPSKPAPDEISRLDECIHNRFQDRTSFGMRRILPYQYHGVRQFRPENATEAAVVNQLQARGYQVALFLAGRNVIKPPTPMQELVSYRNAVQGPAYITRLSNPSDVPHADALIDDGRAALEAFKTSEGYNIQKVRGP